MTTRTQAGANTWSGTQTFRNVGFAFATTLTPASITQTVDWTNGASQTISLSAATGRTVTLTLSNPISGGRYQIKFIGNTTNVVAWPATVKWPGGVAPVITAVSGAIDLVTLTYDGTNYLGTFSQAFA